MDEIIRYGVNRIEEAVKDILEAYQNSSDERLRLHIANQDG